MKVSHSCKPAPTVFTMMMTSKKTKLDSFKELIVQAVPEVVDFEFYSKKGDEFNKALKTFSAELGKIWNDSGFTDFSWYQHKDYLIECIWTYVVSSGAATGNMAKYFEESGINTSNLTCLDYYNGIGLTTIDLINMGFNKVTAYNDVQEQITAFSSLLKHQDEFASTITTTPKGWTFDVVVCLETIEHFKEPIGPTKTLMDLSEQYLVETTSFCSPQHYGHFDKYLIDGKEVSGMTASRRVHDLIRTEFEQVFSGFNGRPRIWKRKK